MTDEDKEVRRECQAKVNFALDRVVRWVTRIPTLEDGTVLESSMLASEDAPEMDEEYVSTIVKATIGKEEEDVVEQIHAEENRPGPVKRNVSPESNKYPEQETSIPKRSLFSLKDAKDTQKKTVSFVKREEEEPAEAMETVWTNGARRPMVEPRIMDNEAYSHPGYNPKIGGEMDGNGKKVTHLKPHEQEYYRLQNYYQIEVPLFPKAIKNLSNNLAMQYTQPSLNEKVPKFDRDYTKWNAYLQAFTLLVDWNPKLPTVKKINRLNAAVEGKAHEIIPMFELDEDSYELVKMALISEYGDPMLGANKILKDLQNMERKRTGDLDGLRNLHVRSKQLVLRLQRLYSAILEQPILISSIIENKMDFNCLMKWEEENTRRRREHRLPPPNKDVAWTLNWLNDYIQTNKRSTIKMELGNDDDPDKPMRTKSMNSNSNGTRTPLEEKRGRLQWLEENVDQFLHDGGANEKSRE